MEKLNKYEIEGRTYQAVNEHEAVKAAYKMAKNYSLKKYIGNDVWVYDANFSNGKAEVIVRRIVSPAASLGSIKSAKKAASSRENGKKGGRPVEKKTYWILSGEGENGTWEKHTATLTGIKRIATKERCGGDRWAQIWEEIPETDTTEAHICNIDDGDMRDIPDEE